MAKSKIINRDSLPNADFTAHRAALKEALMNDYTQNYPVDEQPSWARKNRFKIAGALPMMLVAGVMVLSIATTPLTAQKVLADAKEAQASVEAEQGRYRYTESTFTDEFGGQTNTFVTKLWEDIETGDSRMVTEDANGTVIDTFVTKGGVHYAGGDGVQVVNSGFVLDEDGAWIEGEEITAEELEQVIGDDTSFVISEEELQAYLDDPENSDVAGNFEVIGVGPDGELPDFDGTSVEAIEIGSSMYADDIMRSSTNEERAKLFDKLADEDGAQLVAQQQWEGRTVVGIEHSAFGDFTNTMYFDAETFRYVGSESGGQGFSMKEVIRTETFSNDPIDLSTDGLEELDFMPLLEIE